jgi:hypothetical protein
LIPDEREPAKSLTDNDDASHMDASPSDKWFQRSTREVKRTIFYVWCSDPQEHRTWHNFEININLNSSILLFAAAVAQRAIPQFDETFLARRSGQPYTHRFYPLLKGSAL